ncbi:LysR family transcriptional regulator [Companilactobacillus crustorum]|nr:LysR family transcriptional regulator [Companilactobacillus crustorum]APU70589.1 hypothetical protein BI355_0232 [Companilactobacillus crustorum]WDT65254.1 LysR family transcriptional regulator [Companilactobacillus crustorum]HCD07535.1 LysR family transcriptional regulator [Lactobacillus sp.]
MDTKKLAVFIDLAETQNYSQSAERLFLSQSTISKYIIALEDEWKVKLFIRAHRQVKLTKTGMALLPKAKEILQQENSLNQLINHQVGLKGRPLVIKVLPSLSQYQAAHIITNFAKNYPEIRLELTETNADKLEHALNHEKADIIFTRIFNTNIPSCNIITNEKDHLVALVPKNSNLAQHDYINYDMLKNESILLMKDTISKSNPASKIFQNMALKPKIIYKGQRMNLILDMIDQGVGISIAMNKSFNLTDFNNIKVLPFIPKINSQLAFLKRKDNTSNMVELFWKFALEQTELLTNE